MNTDPISPGALCNTDTFDSGLSSTEESPGTAVTSGSLTDVSDLAQVATLLESYSSALPEQHNDVKTCDLYGLSLDTTADSFNNTVSIYTIRLF